MFLFQKTPALWLPINDHNETWAGTLSVARRVDLSPPRLLCVNARRSEKSLLQALSVSPLSMRRRVMTNEQIQAPINRKTRSRHFIEQEYVGFLLSTRLQQRRQNLKRKFSLSSVQRRPKQRWPQCLHFLPVYKNKAKISWVQLSIGTLHLLFISYLTQTDDKN